MLAKHFFNKTLTTPQQISKYCFSTGGARYENHKCKLLIIGGGSGGCTISAKFSKGLKNDELIVVEPNDKHYYQPMFTLIGGGIKKLQDSHKNMGAVLPKKVKWLKNNVVEFNPKSNLVTISNGDVISYGFLVIAVGLQLNYEKVLGLKESLEIPNSGVASIYSPKYVNHMYEELQRFESGDAIFTFPNSPVKCPGAPQKICYISEHFLRKVGKRSKANITYNTSLPVIFGVKKYADALWKIVKNRKINVNLRTNLIEVKPEKKIAVFENLDKPGEKIEMPYSLLHAVPPMSAPDVLKTCQVLVNENGFVNVDKDTLQHVKFSNIFAIGDCSSTPNSKTAASVAAQSQVVYENLKNVMDGKKPTKVYNGYASCPLVTGYGTCILAEFDYNLTPMETFPISQDKEMWSMYILKKDFMPPLYWNFMLKGRWNGPELLRNIMHLKF